MSKSDIPHKKTKPAISWPGGKTRLLDKLLPLIPEHTLYVEAFGGGLALLLARPRSRMEVANDINRELISFYRCVKFHLDELCRELEFMPNSRADFEDYLSQPGLTEIQRVARWYVRNSISFGGMGYHFGTSKLSGGASHASRAARLEKIRALNQRLDKTCLENLPWDTLIERYDSPETFFFFDPPYFDNAGKAYDGWSFDEFKRFCKAICKLEGQWLLTYQDSPIVREAFSGYDIISLKRPNGIGNRGKVRSGRCYRELIITNTHATKQKTI